MCNRLITKFNASVFIVLLIGSCNISDNKSSKNNDIIKNSNPDFYLPDDSTYPEIIVRQKLEAEYNEAKWNLYLYSSIDTPRDTDGKLVFNSSKPYSAYPMIFDTLYQNLDTLLFYFNFYIEDSILSDRRVFNLHLTDVPAAVYVYGAKRCIYFKGKIGFDYNWICAELDPNKTPNDLSTVDTNIFKSISGRLYFPINPLVVKFINTHQNDLNPWFIKEAKIRGIVR